MKRGRCRICGADGELSFEHVPPKSAFNRMPVVAAGFEQAFRHGPDDQLRGRIIQRGRGDYTLCCRCNNNTGRWYAPDFAQWCFQGAQILQQTSGRPTLLYIHYLFPLRIIKQIVTMFFSVNHSGFRLTYPDLESFVLSRERRHLDPRVRIFAYYNTEGGWRSSGPVGRGTLGESKPLLYSETNFPPYGFVMTYDSGPPDERLVEITHFSHYEYTDFRVMALDLPVLPTHLWYPGDYRTKEQILEDYRRNTQRQSEGGG